MTKQYDPAIADAKRRARRHAREIGVPYQTALDHVAKAAGRDGWSSFAAEPAPHRPRTDLLDFMQALFARHRDRPTMNVVLAATAAGMPVFPYWLVADAYPAVPPPPAWLVAIAAACVLPPLACVVACGAGILWRVTSQCLLRPRTDVLPVEVVAGTLWLMQVLLTVTGMTIMVASPADALPVKIGGVGVAFSAFLPLALRMTVFRPRRRADDPAPTAPARATTDGNRVGVDVAP